MDSMHFAPHFLYTQCVFVWRRKESWRRVLDSFRKKFILKEIHLRAIFFKQLLVLEQYCLGQGLKSLVSFNSFLNNTFLLWLIIYWFPSSKHCEHSIRILFNEFQNANNFFIVNIYVYSDQLIILIIHTST